LRHLKTNQISDAILLYFWEHHSYLFNDSDLKLLLESLFKCGREDLVFTFMFEPTSVFIIKALPFEKRLISLKELLYINYQAHSDGSSTRSGDVMDNSKNEMYVMHEILCERPYCLYALFLFLEKNPEFFNNAVVNVKTCDIDELIRCAPERSENLVKMIKVKDEGKKAEL